MTYCDLECFCRLCLMPLNGTYEDCAADDNYDLRDTIKMVYNIDIKANDEYSTKVCRLCCDILLCNTIHYVRVVEVQKGLSRIQRIRNKLRDFGKKKRTEKKERKHSLIDESIVDVEMIEIESNVSKNVPVDCYEWNMETDTCEPRNTLSNALRAESSAQWLFENLSSGKGNVWPTTFNEHHKQDNISSIWTDENATQNHFDINDYLIDPPSKPGYDENNNNIKHNSSFFQLAKRFCGNMRNSVDRGIDEITKQLALLRFVPC